LVKPALPEADHVGVAGNTHAEKAPERARELMAAVPADRLARAPPPERRAVVGETGAQRVELRMEPMPSLERAAVELLATDQRASAPPVPPVLPLRDRAPAGTALGREPVEPVAPSLDAEARVEATHRPVEHRARAPRVRQSRTEARATT